MSGLQGLSYIVTGGGTGIGAACATRLAADGAAVAICGRTEAKLTDTIARFSASDAASGGGSIRALVADVTSEEDVQRLVAFALEATGSLNGVVANAGGGGSIMPLHLQELTDFTRVLHLNVIGTFLLVKHTVAHLVAAGGGSFVGMSSIAGTATHPYFGAYTVSKAGIESLMRNAADEYGASNVRFNSVRPGFISTEIMEGIPRDSAVFESYLENTPMHGVGEPEDIADLARFLLGPESHWITGQAIGVDGGHSLRRGPDFGSFIEPFLGKDVMLARRPLGG